jgi:formylglycine-generating enzyme required for sulfatase activity
MAAIVLANVSAHLDRILLFSLLTLISAPVIYAQGLEAFSIPSPTLPIVRDCPECPELVILPNSLAMGRYHVTRNEFGAFASATGFSQQGWGCIWQAPEIPQTDQDPVVCVSWRDAMAYTRWLSSKTGKSFRLPTVAEWIYAAKAESGTLFAWGDQVGKANANCDGCGSRWDGIGTAPVGSFMPNSFGLYDITGNAWQWTNDCHAMSCTEHILRGGSWVSSPADLRLTAEIWNNLDARFNSYGFRVVRTSD